MQSLNQITITILSTAPKHARIQTVIHVMHSVPQKGDDNNNNNNNVKCDYLPSSRNATRCDTTPVAATVRGCLTFD